MKSAAPLRVYVDHGEAYGNLGDEAMLLGALSRLQRHLGPCQFVIPRESSRPLPALSGYAVQLVPSPFAFFLRTNQLLERSTARLSRFGVPHPPSLRSRVRAARVLASACAAGLWRDPQFAEFADALRRCDLFYGVGAADFNDYNAFGAAYKCWLYMTARARARVVAVSAQGFGPLRNGELPPLMRHAFRNIDLLSFRDSAYSAEFAAGLGLNSCRTRIVGDEAFALPAADPGAAQDYLERAGLRRGEPFIAVHWRSTDYTQETAPFYPKVAQIFEAASRVHRMPVVFVPMSYDVHSRHDDECCNAVRTFMREPARLLMAPKSHDVGLIKAAIGAGRFTLGLSYHVHIFGLSQGVPAVMIYSGDYYRYKSDGLAGFYGPPTVAVDIAAPGGDMAALQAVEEMSASGQAARAEIVRRNAEILADNDWTLTETAKLLRGRGE
jgi:polysaccharide pyruvyl transferase WcaK-like protein